MEAEENARKWRLSRRRFLQITAAAGASGAIGAAIPNVRWDFAASDNHAPTEVTGPEAGRRLRKWMMIIDLRKCDGCQSVDSPPRCTEACNFGHFVPEPMEWIEVYEHKIDPDEINENTTRRTASENNRGTYFLPTICMQCQNPPCVYACPVGATWKTPEGITLIDQNRCIGCRLCIAGCPYERRFYTWAKPAIPKEALFLEYNVEHQIPSQKGVVYKCDFCPEMARAGRLPFCVQACPQNAMYYGDLEEDMATNGVEVVSVSDFLAENSAFRYKEELGTRPRVYYIPGHGQDAGRDPKTQGRQPVRWQYPEIAEGAKTWTRSKDH